MKNVALHPTGVGMQARHHPNLENVDSRPRGRVEGPNPNEYAGGPKPPLQASDFGLISSFPIPH